ncbi:MAG: hypothetical protein DHS20C09_17430 [marine bacterium B5-7]|nr:MAG: hypothetical protein DHS20C09_17430 [marine bacterium B5-7]
MSSKLAKVKQPKKYDINFAIVSADAFMVHSKYFLNRIGRDMNSAHENASKDLGGLVASATNLALAVEIYLKALWMLLGSPPPEDHNLWSLYKRLPDRKLKDAINKTFDEVNSNSGEQVSALEVAISTGPMNDEELKRVSDEWSERVSDTDLKAVLKRSKDAFVTWRYLYEQDSKSNTQIIRYEFERLQMLASVFRRYIVQVAEERKRRNSVV